MLPLSSRRSVPRLLKRAGAPPLLTPGKRDHRGFPTRALHRDLLREASPIAMACEEGNTHLLASRASCKEVQLDKADSWTLEDNNGHVSIMIARYGTLACAIPIHHCTFLPLASRANLTIDPEAQEVSALRAALW